MSAYPVSDAARDAWILDRRASREAPDPFRPSAYFVEDERSASGEIVPVATVFLTNRECPWRCLMCDLWRNTLTEPTPHGAVATQIDYALAHLQPARQIKLYNSGSFFDRRAIPLEDHAAIAARLELHERVIVESHPALINEDCLRFRDMLHGELEVAMGLETVHPEILPRLNKRMTLEQFFHSAQLLRRNGVHLRVFILVKPPFMQDSEALGWAQRSLDFAFDCGATAATLIPTRAGNGAMDTLAAEGHFSPPRVRTLEKAATYGLNLNRGRVFVDTWDLSRLIHCARCGEARSARLQTMNLMQSVPEPVDCDCQEEC